MKDGRVLAQNAESRKASERLRNLSREGGRRNLLTRAFITSWGSFAFCIAALVLLGEGRHEGLPALVGILSVLGLIPTLFASIVVTGYIVIAWLREKAKRATSTMSPQDVVATAALDSTSLFPVVLLSGCWIFLMIVGGIAYGGGGFLASLLLGPVAALIAVFKFGVMDQRIEVAPHEIRLRLLTTKRTIPASTVSDLAFNEWSRSNPEQPTQLVLRLTNEAPIYLRGNFVSDVERAKEFVAASRTILKLDIPQDAAFETPQDAIRHR